jgi:hypothetical protein
MHSVRDATISGYNEFLLSQKNSTPDGGASFTLVLFNTGYDVMYESRPIEKVPDLNRVTYSPDGGTALLDAVGRTIASLDKNAAPGSRKLVAIFTDGEENSSRVFKRDQIAHMIQERQERGDWTFLFMGANQDAWATAQKMSIHYGNTMSFNATPSGVRGMTGKMAHATIDYRNTPTMASTSFFTTDMSKVSKDDVTDTLTDIQKRVKVWSVDRECDIKAFCEYKAGRYVLGAGYYQLTKKEEIQASKNIMVMEKGKKAVYAGIEARDLLGLPNYTLKVVPGNHANWDIFIQSMSPNRKLVRGTKFIYTT